MTDSGNVASQVARLLSSTTCASTMFSFIDDMLSSGACGTDIESLEMLQDGT